MINVIGGKNFTDAELACMPLVKPENVTERWKGVPHFDLVKTLEDRMDAAGWGFTDRKISVDKTMSDMVGAWNINVPGFQEMPDQQLAIGFQHSNRCKRSLRILVGSEVKVCTNGMAIGEVVLKKKHTINLDLASEIDEALERYVEIAKEIPIMTQRMKERELTSAEADHILMEAGRAGLVGWSTLGDVSEEFLHPTFADNGTFTSWGLYSAFTHIIKKLNPNRQLELVYDFQKMVPLAEVAA